MVQKNPLDFEFSIQFLLGTTQLFSHVLCSSFVSLGLHLRTFALWCEHQERRSAERTQAVLTMKSDVVTAASAAERTQEVPIKRCPLESLRPNH